MLLNLHAFRRAVVATAPDLIVNKTGTLIVDYNKLFGVTFEVIGWVFSIVINLKLVHPPFSKNATN
jgi:hypothetical protein